MCNTCERFSAVAEASSSEVKSKNRFVRCHIFYAFNNQHMVYEQSDAFLNPY